MNYNDRANCNPADLAVIGAGPAGMEAALAAASSGMRVALIDSQPQPGGQYFRQPLSGQRISRLAADEANQLFARLQNSPVLVINSATVWGIFPSEQGISWQIGLQGPNTPTWLWAKSLALATGAYDYPMPFKGWTLPGVMTAGAAQILVKTQGIVPGERILVAGSGPLQFAAATALAQAAKRCGAQVVGVLQAPFSLLKAMRSLNTIFGQAKRLREGFSYAHTLARARIPIFWGWGIREARGEKQVEQAVIAHLDAEWRPVPGSERVLEVDTVISGYGLLPNNHLGRLLGCEHVFDTQSGAWLPKRDATFQTSLPGVYIVGDAAQICGVEAARLEGRLAGIAAAQGAGYLSGIQAHKLINPLLSHVERQHHFGLFLQHLFTPDLGNASGLMELAGEETIACRCEDVSIAQIRQAIATGATSPAEIKMATRCGMGNCQGRMCETTITRALAEARLIREQSQPVWNALSIRPPITPMPISKLTNPYKQSIFKNRLHIFS